MVSLVCSCGLHLNYLSHVGCLSHKARQFFFFFYLGPTLPPCSFPNSIPNVVEFLIPSHKFQPSLSPHNWFAPSQVSDGVCSFGDGATKLSRTFYDWPMHLISTFIKPRRMHNSQAVVFFREFYHGKSANSRYMKKQDIIKHTNETSKKSNKEYKREGCTNSN